MSDSNKYIKRCLVEFKSHHAGVWSPGFYIIERDLGRRHSVKCLNTRKVFVILPNNIRNIRLI